MPARKKMPHSTKDQLDTVEGAPVAFKNWGEALTQVARDRQAQGLPPIITDALILRQAARLLGLSVDGSQSTGVEPTTSVRGRSDLDVVNNSSDNRLARIEIESAPESA